jgi:hypothetical protein
MLEGLLPKVPDVEIDTSPKPVRRSLSMLPDPEPLPPELIERDVARAKAVAEASGFGQSHPVAPKTKAETAKQALAATPAVVDTGRMMRRSRQTELMSTRVTPETLRFLRDYANENDLTFTSVVETIVREFRKSKGL